MEEQMETNEILNRIASLDVINELKELRDCELDKGSLDLADAADAAMQALLCVRDAVKRNGEPLFRWTELIQLCAKHITRRWGK
jgi:hypothetical protein